VKLVVKRRTGWKWIEVKRKTYDVAKELGSCSRLVILTSFVVSEWIKAGKLNIASTHYLQKKMANVHYFYWKVIKLRFYLAYTYHSWNDKWFTSIPSHKTLPHEYMQTCICMYVSASCTFLNAFLWFLAAMLLQRAHFNAESYKASTFTLETLVCVLETLQTFLHY